MKETIDMAIRAYKQRMKYIKTSELMKLMKRATIRHKPPTHSGRKLKIKFVTQARVSTPTFTFFVNDLSLLHFTYERYLENTIREYHPYTGTPMRLVFRDKEDNRQSTS